MAREIEIEIDIDDEKCIFVQYYTCTSLLENQRVRDAAQHRGVVQARW